MLEPTRREEGLRRLCGTSLEAAITLCIMLYVFRGQHWHTLAWAFYCMVQVLAPGSPFKPTEGKFEVINLDFSVLKAKAQGSVGLGTAEASMMSFLVHNAQWQHGIDISDAGNDIAFAVTLWVKRLHAREKRPIVMLVDEYDSLIIHTLGEPAMAELIATEVMAPFFTATKSLSGYFHKVFVTGVSKFGMTSMFSSANQYKLLLNFPDFCSLYGFTEAELRAKYVCNG